MKKLLKTLAFSAAVALAGASAFADGLNAGNTLTIGGKTTDWSLWSQSGDSPTDLGYVSDLTVSDTKVFWWSDSSTAGANMFFVLWDGGAQPVGAWQDVWLGNSTFLDGDYHHDYTVAGPDGGPKDLNATWGVPLEEGKTYYLDVKVKTYNNDTWYPSGDEGAYYHAKFTYCSTLQKFVYNVNDGGAGEATCAVPELQLPIGSTYEGAVQAVWANHWFKGWWTDPTGGTRYQNGKSVVPDNNGQPIQLYAHWTGEQVITFNLNGGDYCSKESMTRPVGDVYWGLPSAPTRDGYKFDGWFTQADGGTRVKNGDPVTSADPLTLYAHWTGRQVVTLDANGGTCAKDSITRPVGDVYWGLPSAPTKDGCKFMGWFTDPENGDRVRNGDPVTSADPLTLYAHWKVRAAPLAITGFSISPRAARATPRGTTTVTDTLTQTSLGITATAYNSGNFSDKQVTSDALYAGQAIKNGTAIQLRKTSPCGIVTTASGGKAKKVTVDWNSGTTSGRYLTVYGKNSAYSTAADLYNSSSYGNELGSITFGSGTELVITDDYEYIGLLASGGNTFVNSIDIEWTVTTQDPTTPTVEVGASPNEIEEGQSVTVTAEARGFSDNDSVNWVWYVGNTQQAETSDTLVLNDLAAGEYQVTAWGYLGDDLATATESDDDTVTITVNPASVYYTITVDNQIEHGYIEADLDMAQDGDTVTLTAHPDAGYALDKFYVDGVELPGNTFVIQGGNVTVSATFMEFYGDVLTRADTGATSSSYVTWTATGTTGTKYAGQSAGGNESIQLRVQSPSGIVITNSNGRDVKSVTVDWNDSTVAARTNQIYGKTTPYSGSADLYGNDKGTLLGEIARDATTFAVPEGYPYIGILAKGGAVYLNSVTIAFAAAEPSVTLSPSGALEVYVNDPVTITATAHDFSGDVDWTWYVDNSEVAGATTATFALDTSVAGSYAVTAMANYGNDEMAESDALNVTVKAPSTPHAIEIETDDNGTVTADPNPAMEGVTVTLTAVPNEGYRLDYVESDEVTITDMQFVMPNQNVGVYAYFEGKHDVVIDDQIVNGSVVASPATAFSDETVTLTVQPDAGYKLDTLTVLDEDANEIPVTDMSFVMPKGDAYVFATFVELPDLYFQFETSESWTGYGDATIAFVNTGSTAEDVSSVSFDTSRTLRGTGSTDKKVGSASIRMAPLKDQDAVVANAAAFAQAITKVAFQYAKYGTDSFESFTVQVSADGETWSDLAIQPAAPTTSLQTYVNENIPEGMKFIRFVTTNSGSSNDHRFNIDEIQIWFADVPMQTFLYDVNDGGTDEASCEVLRLDLPIGSTYEGAVQAVWANHWFKGWWTDPTGGTRYQNGKSVVPDNGGEPIQLYAHWTGEQVITFNLNGGDYCAKDSMTRPVGDVYWGLPSAPTRAGYKFDGWYTQADGGTRVKNGDPVTSADPLTLYAHWTGRQVVTLDANGGTCAKESITRPVGDVYWGLPSAPTKDGCKFLGWFTDPENGTRVRNGDPVTSAEPLTLYAHWKVRVAPLAITGFSVAPRTAAPATRSAAGDMIECTLWVNTIATIDYEVFWTDDLTGEWTLKKRWTAEADGEAVTVEIPADSTTGFFRIVELDVE